MMITLYLAEDQSMLNSALSQLLNLEDDSTVIGSAQDGATAWKPFNRSRLMSRSSTLKCRK